MSHSVEVPPQRFFEAAAAALSIFHDQGWSAEALKPNTVLRVEVELPSTVHDVPLKAVEQWLQSPSASPREHMLKRVSEKSRRG